MFSKLMSTISLIVIAIGALFAVDSFYTRNSDFQELCMQFQYHKTQTRYEFVQSQVWKIMNVHMTPSPISGEYIFNTNTPLFIKEEYHKLKNEMKRLEKELKKRSG